MGNDHYNFCGCNDKYLKQLKFMRVQENGSSSFSSKVQELTQWLPRFTVSGIISFLLGSSY